MVKQTRKRRNTSEKLAMEFCDGSTDVEPVDLGNDKQNKKRKGDAKGKKFEKSDGNVKKVVKDKRTKSSKQTKAIFTEDDEIVQMEVGEEKDKEFVGDDEECNLNEYDKEDTGDTEEEGINEDGELSSSDEEEEEIAEIRSGRSSLDSHVVSFNRSRMGAECSSATSSSNNNNWEKSGGLDDWDPEEEKHMMKFAKFLEAKGFIRNTEENCNPIPTTSGKGKGKGKKTNPGQEKGMASMNRPNKVMSETTVYKGVAALEITDANNRESSSDEDNSKRISTSSEEDTGELIRNFNADSSVKQVFANENQILFQRFLDCRLCEQYQEIQQQDSKKGEAATQAVRPLTAEERAKQMLKQAENAKAKMMPVPDKVNQGQGEGNTQVLRDNVDVFGEGDLLHLVMVDEEFTLIAAHLDEITKSKIGSGDYIDFARLIPKDRMLLEDDKRMEFVVKN